MVERAGELPAGFVVTFPKVLMEPYLGQFAGFLEAAGDGSWAARLRFEIQVEAPQTVLFLRGELAESLGGGWRRRTSACSTTRRRSGCRRTSSGSTIRPATTPGT